MMKIDLHIHTSERSACGRASEEEQIRAAVAAGLDAIAFTDHGALVPADRLERFNRQYAPLQIFGGIEISAHSEDFLVLGIQDAELELTQWTYPSLHAFVRSHNGFIALAHPFRFSGRISADIQRHMPDAIEAWSPNIPFEMQPQVLELAARLNIPMLSNSDAHTIDHLGRYYNRFDQPPRNELGLFESIRSRQFQCVAPDIMQSA